MASGSNIAETTRIVNPETALLAYLIGENGGFIPQSGIFNARVWGQFLGVSDRTIRDWVTQYKIPHRQPGKEMYIDAADFLAAIPITKK